MIPLQGTFAVDSFRRRIRSDASIPEIGTVLEGVNGMGTRSRAIRFSVRISPWMAYLRTISQAVAVVVGIWALGQVFYRPAPANLELKRSQQPEPDSGEVVASDPHAEISLCFIIRTYWAHGAGGDGGSPLAAMLTSLVKSNHKK